MLSCAEYTPKPRGYFRIEPQITGYQPVELNNRPFRFNVSCSAKIELPLDVDTSAWFNLYYPELGAKVYCDYLRITPQTLAMAIEESRALVSRQLRQGESISEKVYSNSGSCVYGSLFLLDGGSASPIQFLLTDSVSNFFRGALYFDCKPNADSLAPAIQYVREDIIELIQSFSWRK